MKFVEAVAENFPRLVRHQRSAVFAVRVYHCGDRFALHAGRGNCTDRTLSGNLEEKARAFWARARTDKELFRYLDGFRETLASDGRYIHLKIDGELVYDTFRKFPPEPRYTTHNDGAAAFTPSYMKDIEDSALSVPERCVRFGTTAPMDLR